jgi:hypothetical protein
MAKTQLIRKSFNAGELSPELHYRDDLEAYVKGCKHLTNMVPTPYGAVTRRPPFKLLSKIDTALYGVPVRYIPFKFSLTEVYHIIFTDGSGSLSTDPTTADLIIFDELGNQVIFDGVVGVPLSALPLTLSQVVNGPSTISSGFVAMATTIYNPADLHDIHFINVNDFVYLTCGGKYPVQAINRFFDKDEGSNRWKITDLDFIGGPLLDRNEDQSKNVTINAFTYDAAKTYSIGDVVVNSEVYDISDAYWVNLGSDFNKLKLVFVLATGFDVEVGDTVNFVNFAMADPQDHYSTATSSETAAKNGPPVPQSLNGTYQVSSITAAGVMEIGYQVRCRGKTNQAYPQLTFANAQLSVGTGFYYNSLVEDNLGNALTVPEKWEPTDSFVGVVKVSSSSPIFLDTDVGRQIAVSTQNLVNPSGSFSENKVSDSFIGQGSIELKTSGGSWGGVLELQESINGGQSWVTLGEIRSISGGYNGSIDRLSKDPAAILRVSLSEYQEATGTGIIKACLWSITFLDEVNVYATITSVESEYLATASLTTPLFSPITDFRWSFGAFSNTSGYPFSLTIHDERLCLGGSQIKPNTVYASRVNDWTNFLKGTLDTSPYTFTVSSDSFDTIRSLKSSRQLNILTDNAENTMGSRDDNAVTSVTNISVSSHTNYGSNEVQAVQMADMIWFVMGQGRRVRASKYDFASDGQQSVEMSLFASHITESGVKEMSFRRHPYNSLFCLLNNGTGCTLTYEGMQEVRAWATVSTEGEIVSAAANYSDTGDIIAGVVHRNGSCFLETFGAIDEGTVFLDNQTSWINANFDIGQAIKQDDDGNLVVVLDDTELVRDVDYTIAGGVLTIPSVTTGNVCIGRRIACRVNPTDISEVAPSGMVKRLTALGMYLLDSGTCTVKINGKESPFTDGLKWVAGQRESGLFELTTGGDYEQGLDVDITIDSHRHFTLTGLGYRLGISQG